MDRLEAQRKTAGGGKRMSRIPPEGALDMVSPKFTEIQSEPHEKARACRHLRRVASSLRVRPSADFLRHCPVS